MIDLPNPALWALGCACVLLLIAAITTARTLLVPNRLSLSAIAAGWLIAALVSTSTEIPSQGGGLLPSLAGTVVAFVLLIPFYAITGLGAGCVKMQMAFGAWVGCALGLSPAAQVVALATVVGGVLTVVGVFIASRRSKPRPRPDQRPSAFPAQVTLSLGSIIGVAIAGWLGWF